MRSGRKKMKGKDGCKKWKGTTLLEEIEKGLKCLKMDFQNDTWREDLPSDPGWYFIKTNTPPEIFRDVDKPTGKKHYNIPEKVEASLYLDEISAYCIRQPPKKSFYFVYSGEAQNLKARAREHLSGPNGCGCLALKNYPELHKYKWEFHYSLCNSANDPKENKLLRIFGEQLWRSKHGWPILCGK